MLMFSIICFMLLLSDLTPVHESAPHDRQIAQVTNLLKKAIKNRNMSKFLELEMEFNNLTEAQQLEIQVDRNGFDECVLSFDTLSFQSRPSTSIFKIHLIAKNILKNNAELSEMVDAAFGKYFLVNIKSSLSVLNMIKDSCEVKILISSAVFDEGNANIIIEYIGKNNLSDKKYYKYFLRYKEN